MAETPPRDYRRDLYSIYRSTHFEETAASSVTTAGQILPHLPEERNALILELGSGSGELIRSMIEAGYSRVSGVDLSEEQVAHAHALGTESVAHGDLFERLAVQEEPLDAAVCVDVLEHLEKPEVLRALQAIRAVLAPGGRVVVRVPNAQSPFGGRFRYGDFTHETGFTQLSAQQVMLATGYSWVRIYPAEPVVHGFISAIRLGLWKLIASIIKFALAVETGTVRGHIVTQNLIVVAGTD
jgi:2-polyprenyl-3-methyl-5-hydroxy-6-metoxy-1,4-benzoquinol methylase